jgi:hypothetical protein
MDFRAGPERYWTTPFEDKKDGFGGLRLHREAFGKQSVAAELTYWDATGGFTLNTLDGVVPVEVVEKLIVQARATIKLR